jgi:CHAD domain-containing protein
MSRQPHLYRPFLNRLDAFVVALPGVERGETDAVHGAREASRRLRETLPLLGLDQETCSKLNRDLRKVTRHLGAARELAVLLLLVGELQHDRRYPLTALDQIGAAVASAHTAARPRLANKLRRVKLERLARRLRRAAEHLEAADARSPRTDTRRASSWALDARLTQRASRLRSAIEAAGAVYAPERVHDVRVGLRRLRYAAELSAEARQQRSGASIAALTATQDVLGRLHDLEALIAWGRDLQASSSPPDLAASRALGLLARTVEDRCRQLHARYMSDRPNLIAIANRLGARHSHPAPLRCRAATS